ncbi:MAG: hypothetical protein CBD18_02445 [Opitutales bacterium TMED158]|nr:MAG: hypothetical protein CBD18_02445 [Opitutales bacterium TMED158]|tara:strand:+ start:1241 stop:1564 length:324 start_codon:yes stop_codon:yes gene_type:complete
MNKAQEIFKAEMSYIDRAVSDVEHMGHRFAEVGKELVEMLDRMEDFVRDAANEIHDEDPVAGREVESNMREFPRVRKDLKNAVNLAITVAENTVNAAGLNARIPYVR